MIEEIGKYHPKEEPSVIDVVSDRAQYWLGVGAQPSEAVEALLKVTGDWQKFKGLPGTEGTLKLAEPKRDKAEIFNEALKESGNEPKADADQEVVEEGREARRGDPRGSRRGDPEAAAPPPTPRAAQPAEADAAETADADKPAEA